MTEATQSSIVALPKNRLFVVAAIVLTLVVLLGFTPTYWIPVVLSPEPLPSLLHLHAALFFGWVALFSLQAVLVAQNRVAVHRKVGIVGAFWAFTTVVTGFYLAITTITRDLELINGTFGAVVTVIPFSQICMFTCFIVIAIANTKSASVHKRFMMLAALVAITPAIARLVLAVIGEPSPIAVTLIFIGSSGLVVAVAWYDAVRHRRLHPVFLYGGLVILLVRVLRVPFAMSPTWRWIAESMSSVVS